MPMTDAEETLAQISDELLGYREGKPEDLLDMVRDLRKLEKAKELVDSREALIAAANNLIDTLEDCGI